MVAMNRRVCQVICALTIFMAMSSTAQIVLGFINLGTFHSGEVKTNVGIWSGILMLLHVVIGLILMGTRNKFVGGLYFLISLACIGVCAVTIFFSEGYYSDFKTFGDFNREASTKTFCEESTTGNQCSCFKDGALQIIEGGFQFQKCPLIHIGEDIWLSMIILSTVSGVLALIGASLIAFTTIVGMNNVKQVKQ